MRNAVSTDPTVPPSRRRFVTQLGRIASLTALGSIVSARSIAAAEPDAPAAPAAPDTPAPGDWDLSWVDRLKGATNRGVFDWSTIETPPDAAALDRAARYLDGCVDAYGDASSARAVIVIRHLATPAALTDAAWSRYEMGTVQKVTDPTTHQPAVRNPYWSATSTGGDDDPQTLHDLVQRGAIILVCNVALTHLASRVARQRGEDPATVQHDFRASLIPTAIVVPSGIFGLVRAQNAGCGLVPS